MDENMKMESQLSSAAAFVEGGIQEACDDACSICLENFCSSDPSTVTACKHEYHLQCILEWCQRSSQCPMCWQPISLKDPTSQELLEAVEKERISRLRQPQNTAIFHHPTLGDFELQHLPVDASEAELEERIIQHLAAAAAMGRAHLARREGHHRRSRGHGRPQYLLFSANSPPVGPIPASSIHTGADSEPASAISAANPSVPLTSVQEVSSPQTTYTNSTQAAQVLNLSPEANSSTDRSRLFDNRYSSGQSTPVRQDIGGPSEFQSLSESLKTRFNAVSMRYKESIVKSTRGWRERLFSHNQSVADIGSEVRREVNAGIATVSRIMERLDTRENNCGGSASDSHGPEGHPVTIPRAVETPTEHITGDGKGPSASTTATSGSI